MYGYMLDNKMAPKTWSDWSYRVLVSGDPPPQFSQYDQLLKLVDNMAVWGLYGAKRHLSSIWAFKLGNIILKQIEATENLAPGAIRSVANAGFQSLQGLYKMYQWIHAPMNAALALTNRPHDSAQPASSSKSKALAKIQVQRRRRLHRDDTPQASTEDEPVKAQPPEPASSSKSKVLAKVQVQRRRRLHRDDTPPASSSEGNGQQGINKQAPLVNYAPGVRQSKRGGGKTITTMAPILEFNETADDPYVMRQQVH